MQPEIPKELIIDFDYKHADKIVRVLHPVVFSDGDSFCCLLGRDISSGISGCGDTPEDAVEDWKKNLSDTMATGDQENDLVQLVMDTLKEHKKSVDSFENQFRPAKKRD